MTTAYATASAELVEDPQRGPLIAFTVALNHGELAKKVPGARWDDPSQTWRVPLTWPACQALRGVFGAGLHVGPALSDWSQREWANRVGPLTALRLMDDLELGGPTAERLWPLQRVAAYAMVLAERYCELDEMGGGKTRTTLAAMKLAAAMHGPEAVFPALVACPNKVRRVWRQQALEDVDGAGPFWPELRIEVMPKGKPAQRALLARVKAGEVDVVATNWESLAGLSRLEPFGNIEMTPKEKEAGPLNEITWRTVVADEAHRMADRRAKQTRALKAVAFGTAGLSEPARFRWPLTGTMVANNSAEAWSILNFVDEVAWPAYSRFVDRYAATTWNQFGGLEIGGVKAETREEFYRCLDPVTIRRLRHQFDPFKPQRLRQTLTLPMETKQASAYKSMAKDMLAELDAGVLVTTSSLTKAGRLDQLAQAYGEMVDKGRRDEEGRPLLDLQLKGPSNKVRAMLELVEERGIDGGPNGAPIVFGAASRQLIALCEEALQKARIPYTLIAGGMSDDQQEAAERAFEEGRTKVALCVIAAAKEGINALVAADTLVFLQRSWSRVENEQFEARVDRPGQKSRCVTIIDVVSEGTKEEFEKLEKLDDKYANFQEVVADERTLRLLLEFRGES